MKELSRRLGVAMLIITHNLGVVARYADRVNVMYAGRIIERGTARELYAQPAPPVHAGAAALGAAAGRAAPRASLAPIEGQPPDLTRLPPAARSRRAAPSAVERCALEVPPLAPIGTTGHVSACWEAERAGEGHEPAR